jgi:hypothetical protein
VTTMTYREVLEHVRSLRPEEQLRLLEDLAASLRRQLPMQPRRSILELQGLGKHLWHGIDAQTYVNQERNAWSG